ncbi:MAG: hypothetical protein ABIF87_02910 [Pseudomonadota bacterium]
MIAHKKEFYGGFGLLAAFFVVLAIIFSPIFEGHNGLDYLDNLYNSISKGSAYYIPAVKEDVDKFAGNTITVTLHMKNEEKADQTTPLLMKGGALVNKSGAELKVSGDLSKLLANCLADADLMYHNDGQTLANKYGYDEQRVLYNWWKALKLAEADLKKQSKFAEAKVIGTVLKKAVEASYNYYKIEPQKIGDRFGVVIFSLVFYVIYTMWYGFAILFMFEGWGLRLEH